jgi:hypothetical protein
MKTALRISLVAALVTLFVAPALAGPTNGAGYYGGRSFYSRVSGYHTGNGGEFTIKSGGAPGLLLSNGGYAAVARGIDGPESFQSFCMEQGEFVAQPMDIWVSTAWYGATPQWDPGTPYQPGSHSWDGGPPTGIGDDLNPQTAYLYYRFATGVLSSYNYTPGAGRNASAGALQNALWFLEGEIGSVSGQAATWVQEAVNATGLAFGTYTPAAGSNAWWGKTIGSVRVLQMYYQNGYKQDQLYVLVPAPAAAVLGACGVGLLAWLRRKFS